MADFHVLVVWNERASTWVEVASSFDRAKLDSLVMYLAIADVAAQVETCAGDSEAVIAFVVDSLPPHPLSFAAFMNELEESAVSGARLDSARRVS